MFAGSSFNGARRGRLFELSLSGICSATSSYKPSKNWWTFSLLGSETRGPFGMYRESKGQCSSPFRAAWAKVWNRPFPIPIISMKPRPQTVDPQTFQCRDPRQAPTLKMSFISLKTWVGMLNMVSISGVTWTGILKHKSEIDNLFFKGLGFWHIHPSQAWSCSPWTFEVPPISQRGEWIHWKV